MPTNTKSSTNSTIVPFFVIIWVKLLSSVAYGTPWLLFSLRLTIRPVLEYAWPVWHTSLPMYLSDIIETIQKRCLRTIFPVNSYDEARSISNLPTLSERRTKSYFRKMHNADHKLNKLLPNQLNIPYGLIIHNTLPVSLARTIAFMVFYAVYLLGFNFLSFNFF